MAEIGRISIRLPSSIKQGDVIRVRSSVVHPMELVQRDKQGTIIRKNYNFIEAMSVTYNGKGVIRAETTQAVSQNPHLHVLAQGRPAGKTDSELCRYHRKNIRRQCGD